MGAEGAMGAELDAYIEGVKKFGENFLGQGFWAEVIVGVDLKL